MQKHLASHLHYDLRLEHPGRGGEGTLLSWAVPKGPSLDPRDKRLAMMVEDHPVEYLDFEGVIPEGYGAGVVMVWDRGTFEPESPDLDRALREGELKFTLHGVKLKGSWVLVRTFPRKRSSGDEGSGKSSWLLIKHRDRWAGPIDVTEVAPLSVKSGGDFADIVAAQKPALWQSHAPTPGKRSKAGAMMKRVLERAEALRAKRKSSKGPRRGKALSRKRLGRR